MKTTSAVVLAAFAGCGIGAVGMSCLRAQPKPPIYQIAMISVTNPDAYTKEYLPASQATIKAHGGVYVAAGPGTAIEGSLPATRFVILRWESLEQLNSWRESPEYTAAHKIGMKYAKFNSVAVNGVPQ